MSTWGSRTLVVLCCLALVTTPVQAAVPAPTQGDVGAGASNGTQACTLIGGSITITSSGCYQLSISTTDTSQLGGAFIEVQASDVIIYGMGHHLDGDGDTADNGINVSSGATNVTIQNLKVTGFDKGISVNGASDVDVFDVNASGHNHAGLYVDGATNVSVYNSRFHENSDSLYGTGYGVHVVGSSGVDLLNVTSTRNYERGIWFDQTNDSLVYNGTIRSNGLYGVYIQDSTAISVDRSLLSGHTGREIYGWYSNGTQVASNTFEDFDDGVYLSQSNDATIVHNTFVNGTTHAVSIRGTGNTVYNNTARDVGVEWGYAAFTVEEANNTVSSNEVYDSGGGIRLNIESNDSVVSANYIENVSGYGIRVQKGSYNVTVDANEIVDPATGIRFEGVKRSSIENNRVHSASARAIEVVAYGLSCMECYPAFSRNVTVARNNVTNAGTAGIYLSWTYDLTTFDNEVSTSSLSFEIHNTTRTYIIEPTIESSDLYDVYADDSGTTGDNYPVVINATIDGQGPYTFLPHNYGVKVPFSVQSAPGEYTRISPPLHGTPTNSSEANLTMTFFYSEANITGLDESSTTVMHYGDTEWVEVPFVSQNASLSAVYGRSSGTGYFAAFALPETSQPALENSPPGSISFGSIAVGDPTSKSYTITNVGNDTLNVTSAAISGGESGDFTLRNGAPVSLTPGESHTFTVVFSPQAGGSRSSTLSLSTNLPNNGTISIDLAGEGLTPTIQTAGAGFGEVLVGNASTSTITIANTGQADLRVSQLTLGGADAGQFAFTDPGAFTLQPGESRSITVSYAPDSLGSHEAYIEVLSDDPTDSTRQVSIAGRGVGIPNVSLSTAALSFGTVQVGQSATETLTVTNVGTGYLDLGMASIAENASAFVIAGDETVLAPGESTTVSVTFAPKTNGSVATTLAFPSNASGSPHVVAVNATGDTTPAIEVTPAPVSFTRTSVGENATRTVTITNVGTEPLSVSRLGLSGADADVFRLGATGEMTIAPGASTNVTLGFAPDLGVAYNATLEIDSDDPDDPTLSVPLSGTGVGVPDATLQTPSAVLATRLGTTTTATIVVANNGTGTLNLTGATVAGTNASAFTVVDGANISIGPGETGSVVVAFAPTAAGDAKARVSISTDDPDTPTLTAGLRGAGLVPELAVVTNATAGGVPVGDAGTFAVMVENTGTANLTINATAILGADAGAFQVVGGGGEVRVAPGETHAVTVAFTPQRAGTHHASLTLASDDADEGTVSVALDGTGLVPQATLSTTAVTFGSNPVASASTRTVRVTNVGNATLSVDDISVAGPDADRFTVVAGPDDRTLAPNASTTVTVRYRPDATGSDAATLSVTTDDPLDPGRNVSLSGSGTRADLTVSPVGLSFGSHAVGDSATRTVTVTNDGATAVEVTVVQVSGPDADAFEVSGDGFVLGPGESEQLTVTFTADADGHFEAELTVIDNSSTTADVGADLSGTGSGPQIRVTPKSVNFGNVTTGSTVTRQLTIRNVGSTELTITGGTITGSGAGAFSTSLSTPVTIAAGTSRTVTVTFAPTSTGAKSAYLRISSDDPTRPVSTVWLTNTETVVAVDSSTTPADNRTTTNVSVENATANSTVPVNVSSPGATATNASVDAVNITVAEGGDFTLNVTQSTRPQDSTPTFNLSTGTKGLGYLNIEHSLPDENISAVEFQIRVKKSVLDATNASPEDVAMYRHHGGRWNELPTTLVGETATHYVFRVRSPGLSDFTTGVKQPKFDVTRATVDVTEVIQGESVAINVRITNTGGADGRFTAQLILNGDVVDTKTVTVAVNGTRQLTFDREFSQPGPYEVRINDEPAGRVVVSQADVAGTPTPIGQDGPVTPALVGGLLAFLVVVGLGGGLLYRRRDVRGTGADGPDEQTRPSTATESTAESPGDSDDGPFRDAEDYDRSAGGSDPLTGDHDGGDGDSGRD